MYYKTGLQRTAEKEFLASEHVISFTHTVVADGIEPDDHGRKIVHKGSLIAASGKVVTVAAGGTFSETPVGILMDALDVTYGPQPAGLAVEAYVIGTRLNLGTEYTTAIGKKIHEALPEIKFRNDDLEGESSGNSETGTSEKGNGEGTE